MKEINSRVRYIGADDTELDLFESQYAVPEGMAYNSYMVIGEKIAVMDTIDARKGEEWKKNLEEALGGRTPDYLVIQHLEPDHSALIGWAADRYPGMTLIATAKAVSMLPQFFDGMSFEGRTLAVKEGDSLDLGGCSLKFMLAPMVHWPEVMVSYLPEDGILFSADAFGKFGALGKCGFWGDEDGDWACEGRRYYFNICGKYGGPVQTLLKKASALDIKMICPLHGPVWRSNLEYFIGKHDIWSRYEPEDKGVVIIYGSIYGHTESAALRLGTLLGQRGVKNIKAYDASRTHVSELVSECFRASHIVLASSTYNNGIFTPMENLLADLKAHDWKRRSVALIENGTWAAASGKLMRAELEQMKDIAIVGEPVSLKSAAVAAQEQQLAALADALAATL